MRHTSLITSGALVLSQHGCFYLGQTDLFIKPSWKVFSYFHMRMLSDIPLRLIGGAFVAVLLATWVCILILDILASV